MHLTQLAAYIKKRDRPVPEFGGCFVAGHGTRASVATSAAPAAAAPHPRFKSTAKRTIHEVSAAQIARVTSRQGG